MLTFLPVSHGNRLAVRATELLTDQDYESTLIPAMEKYIADFGTVRLLIDCAAGFRGWEPAALWDETKFGARHENDFEKIALVGAPLVAEWATRLSSYLAGAELKTFERGEFDEAWRWLNE